ncbi:AGAP008342-PA, partial [Anopheles gambiae str. PEST]
ITDDVAGATFMAAGGSAPELFTSIMGVFVSFNDVGIGTIVGSAVFNILFVIGMCALFSKTILSLTWWPLFRDCTFYSVSLLTLIYFFRDNKIYWWEALVLFIIYILYAVFMKFNQQVERCVKKIIYKNKVTRANHFLPHGQTCQHMLSAASRLHGKVKQTGKKWANLGRKLVLPVLLLRMPHKTVYIECRLPLYTHTSRDNLHSKLSPNPRTGVGSRDRDEVLPPPPHRRPPLFDLYQETIHVNRCKRYHQHLTHSCLSHVLQGNELEEEPPEALSMSWPKGARKRITYLLVAPIIFPLYLTLPDTRTPRGKRFFPITFIGSIVWIAVYSYLMVWWATVVGETSRIPPEVMGLTFLAAGTSIPDLITSVIVARKGFGDMAVSSSVGSNIFDVTVG